MSVAELGDVGVRESVPGGDPLVRVPPEQPGEEVQGLGSGPRTAVRQGAALLPARVLQRRLRVWRLQTRDVIARRSRQRTADEGNHVQTGTTYTAANQSSSRDWDLFVNP